MDETYFLREQTAAKHFILRHYLQGLALITLQGSFQTLTYVDGFSGPWKSRNDDFSDTSFMIAIKVLRDIQWQMKAKGLNPVIKCFFVEKDAGAFAQLNPVVMKHNIPTNGFHVATFHGRFEDAISSIMAFAQGMTLTFIDPTGWTEYAFDKIKPLLSRPQSETLVNFMYDHVSRFTAWDDEKIIDSFNGILRPGWRDRIDRTLPPGVAAERIFRQEFRSAGGFAHAVSTPIKKASDRTHFCITYGTRHPKGLEVYRDVENRALRDHEFRRLESRLVKLEVSSGQTSLFAAADLDSSRNFHAECASEKAAAATWLEQWLRERGADAEFDQIWPLMLEMFMLRKTDAKDVCVELADRDIVEATWKLRGSRIRKPDGRDIIRLSVRAKELAIPF